MATIPIQKRRNIIHNGSMWIEIWCPTSADIVFMSDGITSVETKLETVGTDFTSHITNTTLHKTTLDNTKLSNLATDANATYATKTEVGTHASDMTLHKTTLDNTKLSNLPTDALATFATKEEVAGKTKTWIYADIAEKLADLVNFTTDEIGTFCIVKDPSADTANPGVGPAQYVLVDDGSSGIEWQYLFHMGGTTLTLSWSDITDKPSSTPANIDAAVTKAHEHANKTVIDKLTVGAPSTEFEGELLYDGNPIGLTFNRNFLQDTEPTGVNSGDIWFAPVD